MKSTSIYLFSFLCILCTSTFSQDYEEVIKLVAPQRAIEDYFGLSASISGNYAIIGAYGEDEDSDELNPLNYAGAAYIFERDDLGIWHFKQKLVASDRAANDIFGFSVGISGTYCIVSAASESEDAGGGNTLVEAGSAYIFERDASDQWNQTQKIVASDRAVHDCFGNTVGISGNYAVVGTMNEDEDESGGNTLENAGSAYIFERNENGLWQEVQKIVASDRAAQDRFTVSISISGDYIAVGAHFEDEDAQGGDTKQDAGSAYIFERNTGGHWDQVQKVVASDRAIIDNFGISIGISGDYLIAGARSEDEDASGANTLVGAGSAYIFERDGSGNWNEVQKIVASDRAADDNFGISSAVYGNSVIIGAWYEDDDAEGGNPIHDAGSAYIFERDGSGNWNEVQKIVASDRGTFDLFGSSVCISGDYVLAGVYSEDEDAAGGNTLDNSGSAYIFESCLPDNTSDPKNIIENADFGACMLDPWVLYYAGDQDAIATYQLIDGTCLITPSRLASSPEIWHIQLLQPFSASQLGKLEAGELYTVQFDAWAEENNTVCSVFLSMDEEPWTSDLDDLALLSTLKETYSFDFTLRQVYSSIKLAFSTGSENAWVGFDNVKLMKKSDMGIEDDIIDQVKVWPNPAAHILNVIATNGTKIRLYNNLGRLVHETTLEEGSIEIDVRGLTAGIYCMELYQNNRIYVQKVIIK